MKCGIVLCALGLMILGSLPAQPDPALLEVGTALITSNEESPLDNCCGSSGKWISNHSHTVKHWDGNDVECPCHNVSFSMIPCNTNWAAGGYTIPAGKKAQERHWQKWTFETYTSCQLHGTPYHNFGGCLTGATYGGHYWVAEIKDCD